MKIFDRSAIALFCDDVRKEEGGTRSIIGAFPRTYRQATYPVQIPRITVFARCTYDVERPLTRFAFNLYKNDELLISHPADPKFLEAAVEKCRAQNQAMGVVNTSLRMIGVSTKEECRLIASAQIDDEEYEIGSLLIVAGSANPPD